MNLKPKTILRQLNQLSQIEPKNEAVERALVNARAKLASLTAKPARPIPFNRKFSFLRSRSMFPRVAALVLASAAIVAIHVVLNSSGGPGQVAFAQVIEKVQQTQSLTFKTKGEGRGHTDEEMRITILPDGKMRSDNSLGYSIQDFKAHKMIIVQKESKTVHILEGVSPPTHEFDKVNLYEIMRNIQQDAIEHLPDEEIGGRKAMVFHVDMKELPKISQTPTWKVWVDAKTELPIRLEGIAKDENGKEVKEVMYDIEFDRPIAPSLFSFTPPEGYMVQTFGIKNFPDLPDKPELRAPEIIPGVGLGPIRFGMSREKIESLLGKPDGYEANETFLLYYSRGFTLSVSKRSGLQGIHCTSQTLTMNRVRDFAGKTKEGIGIGSSPEECERAFGEAEDEGIDAFNKRLAYDKCGLEIQFVDDKAIMIDMSAVDSQTGTPPDGSKDAAEKQEPKNEKRSMRIDVVGPDGKPIAGAKILAAIWSKDRTAKTNQEYVSDSKGLAVVELPTKFDILRLFTRCDGYVPLFTHWEQLDESPPNTFTIKLAKGTTIGGLVKNAEGQPIAGAKVEVMLVGDPKDQLKRTSVTHWLASEDDAKTTDVKGRWMLDNVPAGDVKLMLKISHSDYAGDADWGGLQKEQKISVEDLRKQKATIIMRRKK